MSRVSNILLYKSQFLGYSFLAFGASVDNVDVMLLVTIESKGDCVDSVDLSEKCYLVHNQVETIKTAPKILN